eukprot:ctg_317.g215
MFFRPPYLGPSRIDEILDRLEEQERAASTTAGDDEGHPERPTSGEPSTVEGAPRPDNASATAVTPEAAASYPTATLRSILDEDDLVSECKAMNLRLFRYFSRPEVLPQLVSLAVAPASADARKYSNVATEVLCSDVERLNEALVSTDGAMGQLLRFVDAAAPMSPELATNFAKVFLNLLRARPDEVLDVIDRSRESFLCRGLVRHIYNSSLANIIVDMLMINEIAINKRVVTMYAESDLLRLLVDKLVGSDDDDDDDEVLSNVVGVIVAISGRAVPLAEAPEILGSMGRGAEAGTAYAGGPMSTLSAAAAAAAAAEEEAAQSDRDASSRSASAGADVRARERQHLAALDLLRQPSMIGRMLDAGAHSDKHLLHALTIVNELLSTYRELQQEYDSLQQQQQSRRASGAHERSTAAPASNTTDGDDSESDSSRSSSDGPPATAAGTELAAEGAVADVFARTRGFEDEILSRLSQLLERLRRAGTAPLFGVLPLKLTEFVGQMMYGGSRRLTRTMLDAGVPKLLVYLFVQHPWVSMLHQLFRRIVEETLIAPLREYLSILSEGVDEAIERTAREDLLVPERLRAWLSDAALLRNLLDVFEWNGRAEDGRLSREEMLALARRVPQLQCDGDHARPPPPRLRLSSTAHVVEMLFDLHEQLFARVAYACVSGTPSAPPRYRGLASGGSSSGSSSSSSHLAEAAVRKEWASSRKPGVNAPPLRAILDDSHGQLLAAALRNRNDGVDPAELLHRFEQVVRGPVYQAKASQRRHLGGRRPTALPSFGIGEDFSHLAVSEERGGG